MGWAGPISQTPAAAALDDYVAAVWSDPRTDTRRLELCRRRMAHLLGVASEPVEAVDEGDEAAVAFAEQWLLDASGVTPDDCARLRAALGDEGCAAFTLGLSLVEARLRLELALGLSLRPHSGSLRSPSVRPSSLAPRGRRPWRRGGPRAAKPPERSRAADRGARPEPMTRRIDPPPGGTSFLDHVPELYAAFNRFYGVLWSHGVLDQPTKEVARLRNARVTGCGICRNLRFAGARDGGLSEDLVDEITDAHGSSDALPERWRTALRFVDVVLSARPDEVDPDLRSALLDEFTPAEIAELALTTAIAQGFSKAAVAWGPAPDIPLTVVPTPGSDL